MIKCVHCKKDAERFGTAICINADGDFVCGVKCKKEYEKERDRFLNEILLDDKKYQEWLNDMLND